MKADVVFMGGGMAALVAGIKLLKSGRSVIIISAGQSALHFSSGSLCLLNKFEDETVLSPFEHIDSLPTDHPYKKIGVQELKVLLSDAVDILGETGIELVGNFDKNHFRLTPLGLFEPAWMTLSDHLTVDDPSSCPYRKVSVIGIDGFLDFYPEFIAQGLEKFGVECVKSSVNITEFNLLRNNPTEMRAPNIARALTEKGIKDYAQVINRRIYDSDIAIIPSVVGLNDTEDVKELNSMVECPVFSVPTIPVSVTGIRMKILLQNYFTELGGWYLLGDSVTNGHIENNRLQSINTVNLGSTAIVARDFVLSTGGLFSRGLKSDIDRIFEPIFDLDITCSMNREDWYDKNFYHSQPFMRSGVKTDEKFRCSFGGVTIENLYAAGGVLGGNFDPLYDGVGAGVTLASAMQVVNQIIN